jgi:hypothetical protein
MITVNMQGALSGRGFEPQGIGYTMKKLEARMITKTYTTQELQFF